MLGHEDTGTAGLGRALTTKTLDLAALVNLVVSKGSKLERLVDVLDLLGLGVHLLLALLSTTTEAQDQMESALLLDVVVAQGATILQLLAGEDETLLIRRDTFLILDLLLDSLDGVRALHLEGDGLAREGLHENLHDALVVDDDGVEETKEFVRC